MSRHRKRFLSKAKWPPGDHQLPSHPKITGSRIMSQKHAAQQDASEKIKSFSVSSMETVTKD